jgi:DNA-directed RNA polymerase specialized sigma24 family protein
MANRLASRYNFHSYTFREEMVGDAILTAVKAVKKFDPARGEAFAFFTKVIWRTFLQRIKKEKSERSMRDKLIMTDDLFTLQEGDSCGITKDSIIGDFEFNSGD